MQVETTKLEGVLIVTPRRFEDARGSFSETWNRRALADAGLDAEFVQDNHSVSRPVHTLRGLHFQAPPHAQAKLVRCVKGRIWDVAVDARRGSPQYGEWVGAELSADNARQLYVPEGFLHGFVTLEPDTEVLYKCTDYYAPEADGAVLWSSCGIAWPFDGDPVLSDKDRAAQRFDDFDTPFARGAAP